MEAETEILLAEYAQIRESERAARTLLQTTNGFAVAVVSGLLLGIIQYKVAFISLLAPLILYLVGFQWSSEALRLLRLTEHCRTLERALRRSVHAGSSLPLGFEDSHQPGYGMLHLFKFHNIYMAAALFYGIFYAVFFYFLLASAAPMRVRYVLFAAYLVAGGAFWGWDLWHHRMYLFRSADEPRSEQTA
jgi:hypothetical protein